MIFSWFLAVFTIQICLEIFAMISSSERMQSMSEFALVEGENRYCSKMIFPFSGGTEKENEYTLV